MKTIGVLGGMGPQATMDFEARLHQLARRRIPAHANAGYPPMVVYYHRALPFAASDTGAPVQPPRPDPALLDAATRLGSIADFLVITANMPHLFSSALAQASGRPVLSMIDATLAEVARRNWQTVGVLGMGDPVVYTQPLAELGRAIETIDDALRARLDAAILAVMEGRSDDASEAVGREAVEVLRERGVDGIILGCTEIPLLLGDEVTAPDLVNPLQQLAEVTIDRALA